MKAIETGGRAGFRAAESVRLQHPFKWSTVVPHALSAFGFVIQGVVSMGISNAVRVMACVAILSIVGCGGGDDSGVLKVEGGKPDEPTQIAEQNKTVKADPNDPNFEKMAAPNQKNTARNPGVSSGGGTSSAILD
jgi:hypothetical protein